MENKIKLTEMDVNNAINDLRTIQDFIRWAYSRFCKAELFYGHGTDNPGDEASSLVLQLLDLPSETPDTLLQSRLTTTERKLIAEKIAMRINQKTPVGYLTNKAYFCDEEYYVDERVLIPRSPIAELIKNNFSPWIISQNVNNILDLCTGSGCIAIACAIHFPDAIVDGGDISMQCIEVAELNREKFQMDNVAFYQSDLFENIPHKKYDIIVSNPPYVDAEDFLEIPQEYLAEPKLGLTSGKDGLELTRIILAESENYLADDGVLIIEVGNSAEALEDAYPELDFTWIDFEFGGHGVFILTKTQLIDFNKQR